MPHRHHLPEKTRYVVFFLLLFIIPLVCFSPLWAATNSKISRIVLSKPKTSPLPVILQNWINHPEQPTLHADFQVFWQQLKPIVKQQLIAENGELTDVDFDMYIKTMDANVSDPQYDFKNHIRIYRLDARTHLITVLLNLAAYQGTLCGVLWDGKEIKLLKLDGQSDQSEFSKNHLVPSAFFASDFNYKKSRLQILARSAGFCSCCGNYFEYIYNNNRFLLDRLTEITAEQQPGAEIKDDVNPLKACAQFPQKIIYQR